MSILSILLEVSVGLGLAGIGAGCAAIGAGIGIGNMPIASRPPSIKRATHKRVMFLECGECFCVADKRAIAGVVNIAYGHFFNKRNVDGLLDSEAH